MAETENVKNLTEQEVSRDKVDLYKQDPLLSLMEWLNDKLAGISPGISYEVITLERELKPRACLRAYIDFKEKSGTPIGVEDCAAASEKIGELLETPDAVKHLPLLEGEYDLEVSSPGINRPLKRAKDFEQYSGSRVKINLYRPATAEELNDAKYFEKNPSQ